jgi:hypothetical protein
MRRQAHDRPSAVERTLEAVARRDAEHDSLRRRLFNDESRRSAAIHAETLLGDSPIHVRFLPAGSESIDAFANSMSRETGLARSRIGRESSQPPGVQPELALVGDAEFDRYMSVKGSFAPSPERSRLIAAHAGLIEGLEPSSPTRLLETAIGNEKYNLHPDDKSGRDATNDALARLASRYTAPVSRQHERVVPAHATPGREAELIDILGDHATSGQIYSQTEMDANERQLLSGGICDESRDHAFRSPRMADPREQVDSVITNDLTCHRLVGASALGADLGGFGDMIGQGDQRPDRSSPHPTLNRDGVWKSDDGASSNTATTGAVQEALAAAADELERLRSAVRRTIDELERVHGSVQRPLPALPVNRGTFRIS